MDSEPGSGFLLEHEVYRTPRIDFRVTLGKMGRRHRRLPAGFMWLRGPLRCATALLRHGVVVAALELHPVGLEIFRTRQVIRPSIAGHQALGLPHHVELAV